MHQLSVHIPATTLRASGYGDWAPSHTFQLFHVYSKADFPSLVILCARLYRLRRFRLPPIRPNCLCFRDDATCLLERNIRPDRSTGINEIFMSRRWPHKSCDKNTLQYHRWLARNCTNTLTQITLSWCLPKCEWSSVFSTIDKCW